jgi:hypothetical protein
MSRLSKTLAIAAVLALGVTGLTRAEVWVELDGSGHVVRTHIPSYRNEARVWRATGAAPTRGQVLNVEGAARGDGRPDIAIDPVSGLPRAVWSMHTGLGFDVVTSTFDGHAWTEPIPITSSIGVDDLDPRIAFRHDGMALVTWWTHTAISTVQLAALPAGGTWHYLGMRSQAGEKAKLPAIRQEGNLTIIAFRTPMGLRITAGPIVDNDFGDGPTPFPRDSNHGGPDTGDEPPSPPNP